MGFRYVYSCKYNSHRIQLQANVCEGEPQGPPPHPHIHTHSPTWCCMWAGDELPCSFIELIDNLLHSTGIVIGVIIREPQAVVQTDHIIALVIL